MSTRSAGARNRPVFRHAPSSLQGLLFLSFATPIGRVRLAASAAGLIRVQLPGAQADARMDAWLAAHFPRAVRQPGVCPVLRKAAQQVEAYFTGDLRSFSLPLELAGTPFQVAVWKRVADVPFGATQSYAGIARALGNPQAVRAVGAAQGANPVPIVVPCHRIVGSNGALTGYAGGIATKRWLLEHERDRTLNAAPEARSAQLSLFADAAVHTPRAYPAARPARTRPRP